MTSETVAPQAAPAPVAAANAATSSSSQSGVSSTATPVASSTPADVASPDHMEMPETKAAAPRMALAAFCARIARQHGPAVAAVFQCQEQKAGHLFDTVEAYKARLSIYMNEKA
ncbi:MAG: hypothetical protein ABF876_05110 [Acetobacter aceti]